MGLMTSHFISEYNGPKTSRIQQDTVRDFKILGFKIDIMSKQKVENFLDITFNLYKLSFHKNN